MPIELKTYDVAEHLDSEEEIRLYLEAAFEDGDSQVVTNAIANAVRAPWRKGQSRLRTCQS